LERVLASPGFARNERLSRFLRFVVERHLEGRDQELKESLIAIEVFGRSPGYDSKQDPIVRTEASRLRARLSEYYLGEGKGDSLAIELPKGGYVPVLRQAAAGHVPAPPRRFRYALSVVAAIACALVALLALVGWRSFHQNAPIPIAVLPLNNLSDDPAHDYFADGLTGEIIRNLSIIDGLAVRSQTSSFAFKGKAQSVHEAAKQLEADYILEGSVQRTGQQLRITAQLVRASDDFPLWSGRYDRELTDVFAIQDEISRGIVNSLRLKLGRGRRRYETSTEAYDLYLRARALGRGGEFGMDSFRQSIPVFEQAIAKDPAFAPAYAGLALAHVILSGNFRSDIPDEVAQMRRTAEKAVQLDPLSAESYTALGGAAAREGRWVEAEKHFLHAIEIEPGRAESHTLFAAYLLLPLGRLNETIEQLRIAEKNDPLSSFLQFWLGDALADAGRYQEAVAACEKVAPSSQYRWNCAQGAVVHQGKAAEVIQHYEGDAAKHADMSTVGCAYARLGRREEAEKVLAAKEDSDVFVHGQIYRALLVACLGDRDRVFEMLNHDAGVGPIRMGWILNRVARENSGLRSDPRWKALRKKVGLPE
jgi:TolB-like protein